MVIWRIGIESEKKSSPSLPEVTIKGIREGIQDRNHHSYSNTTLEWKQSNAQN
ncbi:hypothetical protein ADIS_0640 [Lunatimonas lonarensis]|uniref:Uncharacterized protein n=1 Tax=Lunatimonas lonarensis TaxID=1232681 RepID=R7ZXK3_9BACT|nr:hypothetical protein ADIS_0640 [Lunatimonas lonarensis]